MACWSGAYRKERSQKWFPGMWVEDRTGLPWGGTQEKEQIGESGIRSEWTYGVILGWCSGRGRPGKCTKRSVVRSGLRINTFCVISISVLATGMMMASDRSKWPRREHRHLREGRDGTWEKAAGEAGGEWAERSWKLRSTFPKGGVVGSV